MGVGVAFACGERMPARGLYASASVGRVVETGEGFEVSKMDFMILSPNSNEHFILL